MFAVPAPTDGAVKYPLGHVSFSSSKYGTGFSENVTSFKRFTSKNDSSCKKMMFGTSLGALSFGAQHLRCNGAHAAGGVILRPVDTRVNETARKRVRKAVILCQTDNIRICILTEA